MSDVFISYSSVDRDKAELLAGVLAARGLTVWWDRTIPPGRAYDELIETALGEARCVVVLWSSASISSQWVKTEAAEGARRDALVPALLDGGVSVPLEFRRIQAADLSDWQGEPSHSELEKLLTAIEDVAASSARSFAAAPARPRGTSQPVRGAGPEAPRNSVRIAAAVLLVGMAVSIGLIATIRSERREGIESGAVQDRPAATLAGERDRNLSGSPTGSTGAPVAEVPTQLPAGQRVTVGGDLFEILSMEVHRQNYENLVLDVTARMTNNGRSPQNFWDNSFRLQVDGVPRAPISGLNELVEGQAAKDGVVTFVFPQTFRTLDLVVLNYGETTKIPIDVARARR